MPRGSLALGGNRPQRRLSHPPAPTSRPTLGRKILSRYWVKLGGACPVLAPWDPLWGGTTGSPPAAIPCCRLTLWARHLPSGLQAPVLLLQPGVVPWVCPGGRGARGAMATAWPVAGDSVSLCPVRLVGVAELGLCPARGQQGLPARLQDEWPSSGCVGSVLGGQAARGGVVARRG